MRFVLSLSLLWGCAPNASPDRHHLTPSRPGTTSSQEVFPPSPGFAMRNQDGLLIESDDLLGHPVLLDIGFVD